MSGLTPALIARVAKAERAGASAIKERARAIRAVDQATGGRGAQALRDALAAQGLSLSHEQVRQARKIAGLLHRLDPGRCDPPGLLGYFGEPRTLYLLARAAELTNREPARLLAALNALATDDARDVQLAQWTNRKAAAQPAPPTVPWVPALPDVPDDVAARMQAGHARFGRALDATHLQTTERLADLLGAAPDSLWRFLTRLDARTLSVLGAALDGAARCAPPAPDGTPTTAGEAAAQVALVLGSFQHGQWTALHRAYRAGAAVPS